MPRSLGSLALLGALVACSADDSGVPDASASGMPAGAAVSGAAAASAAGDSAGAAPGNVGGAAGRETDPGSIGAGTVASGSGGATGGSRATSGPSGTGGVAAAGRSAANGGSSGSRGTAGASADPGACSGPFATFSGELATGITFMDDRGQRVNAHGGGIIKQGDTYYLHGEYFSETTTDNNFNGFSMYSSKDLASWKWEKLVLPQQPSGLLGPKRKGERPHIIQCPSTGEFVLYAHAASEDYQTDKEVVYATSPTVNGDYAFAGALTNANGQIAAHSDMSAITDGDKAYVVTESGHVYTLAADCHSWVSDKAYSAVNADSGGSESPTVFKAGDTYYWIGSYKTGWRANNNFYSTAPAVTGPWTYRGFLAPVSDPKNNISDERTWLSQSTWVAPVQGCNGTVYLYWGDHWDGTIDTKAPGRHNHLATYVFQPLVFNGDAISLPSYRNNWKLDVGEGTWSE